MAHTKPKQVTIPDRFAEVIATGNATALLRPKKECGVGDTLAFIAQSEADRVNKVNADAAKKAQKAEAKEPAATAPAETASEELPAICAICACSEIRQITVDLRGFVMKGTAGADDYRVNNPNGTAQQLGFADFAECKSWLKDNGHDLTKKPYSGYLHKWLQLEAAA